MTKIAIIGGGQIGEALIAGLIAAGREPSTITVTNRTQSRRIELTDTYGVATTSDNVEAVSDASVVFLAVKPKGILRVIEEISATVDANDDTTLVSLAAGVGLAAMEDATSAGTPIVRVMPNTPMLVRKGVSGVSPGRYVDKEQLARVTEMLESVGDVVVVAESDMDAVAALSGSAPAYYFLITEALIDAGVQLGLTRDVATRLAKGSATGAGALLEQSGAEPAVLRANITSPGGTTAAALRELEESGVRGAFYRAAERCAQRSAELGK